MGHGHYPWEYFQNPAIDKPIEAIYADMDAFTYEVLEPDQDLEERLEAFILLPPVSYDGVFLKGLLFSISTDALLKRYPGLKDRFVCIAYSGWISYPWSTQADAYLSVYPNPQREAWYRRTHPERAHLPLIPFETPEYFNPYVPACTSRTERDIDVMCVSRLDGLKNVPMVAEAIKIYRQKYGKRVMLTLLHGWPYDINLKTLSPAQRGEVRKIEACLTHPNEYIQFIPKADYYHRLMNLFAHAQSFVLGSLLEGKNRSLHEAMASDVPVACFEAFNQYARGPAPVLPEGAGLAAPFHAEGMADTLHTILQNRDAFHPRQTYLTHYGRSNFMSTCVDYLPYYREHLPGYTPGQHIHNLWLDLAIQKQYGISFYDFLHGRRHALISARSIQNIAAMAQFYLEAFPRVPVSRGEGV
jgi:hypothetical protein